MKIQKKKQGWILEELDKQVEECLDPKSFGGEDPEEVEKQREKNDKEINKRLEPAKKEAEKVVGEDHVELPKTTKVEEHFKTRKELSALLESLKGQTISYQVNRSTKEDFRWCVTYNKLDEGFVKEYKGYKIIETPEVFVITKNGATVGESKTIPGCEGIIDEMTKDECKESLEDDIADNLVAFGICADKEEASERVSRMSPEAKQNWKDSFSGKGREVLLNDSLHEDKCVREYTPEEIEKAKKYQAINLKREGRNGDKVSAMTNDEFVSHFLDILGAEGLDDLVKEANDLSEALDKHDQTIGNNGEVENSEHKWDAIIYDMLSSLIFRANEWGEEVKLKDLESACDFALIHLPDEFDFVESLKEDLPDVIPAEEIAIEETPVVVPTEPIEEVTEEVVENGIYLALSGELRDTLADVENLKGLTVTLADEDKEEVLDELNAIIDDRTIHIGMLQDLMNKFDAKIEVEEPKEVEIEKEIEVKEE